MRPRSQPSSGWILAAALVLLTCLIEFTNAAINFQLSPPPTLRSINVTRPTTGQNATAYVSIPPVSMDKKLYLTINICAPPKSNQYPILLLSNSSLTDLSVSPWDEDFNELKPKQDRSGSFDEFSANRVVELTKGEYLWFVNLEYKAGFGNWTGWMGDGGVLGIFGDQGDDIDVEVAIQMDGESVTRTCV